jgi:hypothetical protein
MGTVLALHPNTRALSHRWGGEGRVAFGNRIRVGIVSVHGWEHVSERVMSATVLGVATVRAWTAASAAQPTAGWR